MAKFIVGDKLLKALHDAGAIAEDYATVRRIVIDLEYGSVAKLYVEKFGDDKQLTAGLIAGLTPVETALEAGVTRGTSLP